MRALMESRGMYGLQFSGKRYDIGNRLDFLKTNIEFALKRPDLAPQLIEYIKELTASDPAFTA